MNFSSATPRRSEADEIVALRCALALANLQIDALKEQLRLQRIKKYGPGSEKLDSRNWNSWNWSPE